MSEAGALGSLARLRGEELDAVGEAELGDFESVSEAEHVEVGPRLRGADGDVGLGGGV